MTQDQLFLLLMTKAAAAGVHELQLVPCGPDEWGHSWFYVYCDLEDRGDFLDSLVYGNGPLNPSFGGCYSIKDAPSIALMTEKRFCKNCKHLCRDHNSVDGFMRCGATTKLDPIDGEVRNWVNPRERNHQLDCWLFERGVST